MDDRYILVTSPRGTYAAFDINKTPRVISHDPRPDNGEFLEMIDVAYMVTEVPLPDVLLRDGWKIDVISEYRLLQLPSDTKLVESLHQSRAIRQERQRRRTSPMVQKMQAEMRNKSLQRARELLAHLSV